MARRPKIWTALAPATLGATAVLLLAFASPGMTGSGGGAVVIPLTDFGWPEAPALGEALSAPLALRGWTRPAAAATGPRHTPARGPQLAETHAPDASDASDDAAGEGPRFVLIAVAVEGVTVYGPDELRPLYQDLLGQEIALDAVFALAEAITAYYRNHGYTLSQAIVPPQTISAGKVRLTVVEGFIDKVLVEGDTRGRAGLFRAWGEKIKASRPFEVSVLERYSLLANDLPGAQVRAVLRPSEETPGAADLIFEVKHQIVEAAANLDNRAPKTTGPLQGLVSVSGNSLLGLYDRTTLTYSGAKTRKRSQFASIRHDQVLNSEGSGLSLSASYSRSKPGDVLKDLNLFSESTVLSAEVTHPVIRSRNANLNLSAGFTYREVKSDAVQDGVGTITLDSSQSLTTAGGSLDLAGADVDIQGTIDTDTGDVKIGPNSDRSFSLGAVAADFNLTDPELDRITTSGNLKLGGPDASSIELDGFSYSGSLLWIGSDTGPASIVFLGLTSSASGFLALQSTSSISGGVSGGDIETKELEIEGPSVVLTGSVGGLTGQDAADLIVLTSTGGGPYTFNGFTIPLTLTGTTAAAVDQAASLITTSPDTTTTDTTTTDTIIVEPLDASTSETTTVEETVAVVEEIATSESLAEAVDYMSGEGEFTLGERAAFFETLDGAEVVDGLLTSSDPLAQEIGQVFEDVLAGRDVSQAQMKAELQVMGLSGGKLLTYLGLYLRVQKEKRNKTLKLALEELAEDDERAKVKVRAARPRAGSGRRIALLIGVQDYAEPIPDLVTPVADVEAVGALFESKLGYEVRVLRNPAKAEIVAALQALVDELGEQDSAIVMYAGHGYILESSGVGYWLAADARTDSAERWISNTSISEVLNAIQSKNVMLIADSCYSGTLLSGEHEAEGVRVKLSREQLRDKRSVVILSSGGEEPVQDAGGDGHSVFARQLMTALQGLRADGVGSELYEQIKSRIAKLAPQVPQYGGVISAGHELGGDHLLELGS